MPVLAQALRCIMFTYRLLCEKCQKCENRFFELRCENPGVSRHHGSQELTNISESIIDISSMRRALAFCHLVLHSFRLATLSNNVSLSPMPSPIPANEWSVVPPMLQAAKPVDAVTYTALDPCFNLQRRTRKTTRKPLMHICNNIQAAEA